MTRSPGAALFRATLLFTMAACAGACGDDDANESGATPDAQATDTAVEVQADAADAESDAPAPDADLDAAVDAEVDAGMNDLEVAGPLVWFEGRVDDPDVRTERLCPDWNRGEELADTVNIDCVLEGGSFVDTPAEPKRELVVLVWNMERGLRFDEQLVSFADRSLLPEADVLLLSELDRGCSRTGHRDVARELARALGMHYVFVTEFIELPRITGAGGTIDEACEHGNAILSRYPMANVGWTWHRQNHVWYLPPDARADGEPRLGGRVLLWADIVVGDELLRAYTLHYESNPVHQPIQIDQAAETAELAAEVPWQTVVGGDTNNALYFLELQFGDVVDPTLAEFFARGFIDAHAPLPFDGRGTRNGLIIDLLFGSGPFFRDPGICPRAQCDTSDHQPVWATVTLDGDPG